MLGDVIRAAVTDGAYDDALTLLSSLSDASTRRPLGQLGVILPEERNDLVAAVIRNDVWEHVLPSIDGLDGTVLRGIINVPAVHHSKLLAQADVRMWLTRQAGVAERLVVAVLAELGFEG